MKVQAKVIYPVCVEIDVPEDIDGEELNKRLLDEADALFETSTICPDVEDIVYVK